MEGTAGGKRTQQAQRKQSEPQREQPGEQKELPEAQKEPPEGQQKLSETQKEQAGIQEKLPEEEKEPPLPTIDSCLEQLEGILRSMEDEAVSLEQSFSLYEQGMKLVKDINGRIDQVEKDILVLDGEGEI
ncbi:exodeoxyribonuclease VII small subunit [Lachnospiraceae bacterium]|nr:exodeoxyribonuclease VII small subunit [Lachnospiraceae bacterium]